MTNPNWDYSQDFAQIDNTRFYNIPASAFYTQPREDEQ